MYLCAQNHDLKRGGTFETAKAGTFHSVTAGTSIPLFTLNDSTTMNSIVPKFSGTETIDEVSRHLAGIIFIDDNSIKEDSYSCNVIMNPNAVNVHAIADHYLMSLVENGDKRGLYDDLRYDNY